MLDSESHPGVSLATGDALSRSEVPEGTTSGLFLRAGFFALPGLSASEAGLRELDSVLLGQQDAAC
eukprot:6061137-Alexandrium_andersonii.AAC.1